MTIKEFLDLNKEVIEYRNCVALMEENLEDVPVVVYQDSLATLWELEGRLMTAIDLFYEAVDNCTIIATFNVTERPDNSGIDIEAEL